VRTPKTGRLTGAIHHLVPVEMIEQWAIGLPRRDQPAGQAAVTRASATRRRLVPRLVTLSIVALLVLLTIAALGPAVSAASGDYYLHRSQKMDHVPAGSGLKVTQNLAPGTTATWTSTDTYASGMVIPAGTYTFTADWQKDANATASITFTVGYAAGGCTTFTPLVSWTSDVSAPPLPTATSGSTTSATELGPGGPFNVCFRVHVNSITCAGAKCPLALLYDSSRFQAILSFPGIEVSEHVLPLAGLGLLIPIAAGPGSGAGAGCGTDERRAARRGAAGRRGRGAFPPHAFHRHVRRRAGRAGPALGAGCDGRRHCRPGGPHGRRGAQPHRRSRG